MLLSYRVPGMVACVALIAYGIFVYALFRLLGVTLTLAGIAAFILSVGMAVDANILIFERTKEELRSGKSLSVAVEAGFSRAWNSIFDSNVSTLITAFILFQFGSSVVKGFALVLGIGVLVSMFTAIALSRMMLRWVVRQPWARRTHLFGVPEQGIVTPGRPGSREAQARV
jgi:preprotein translocase subunit SecD